MERAEQQQDASEEWVAVSLLIPVWRLGLFNHRTVDSMILNCDRPLGVTALILLNKTQDS